jgi:riboflavin transporter FmnP
MNAKRLAMSIAFAVVAMVLNPAITGIKIPSPFLTGLYYQVWDIPIIAAFLLLGFKYGFLSGVLNSFFLFAVFPGPAQWAYAPGNLAAQTSMMIGIYLAQKLVVRTATEGKVVSKAKTVVASTALGIVVRIPVMMAVMYVILRYAYAAPDIYTFAVLPIHAIYCIVMALYTIPTAYLIARTVNKSLKVGNQVI